MSSPAPLNVFLNDKQIGTISHLPGDKNLFTFVQTYIDDPHRPTLSLSFKNAFGELETNIKITRTRLPPFFANLLPEGLMRDYLASRAHLGTKREFFLLSALGSDLPGAITVHSSDETGIFSENQSPLSKIKQKIKKDLYDFPWQACN